MSDDLVKRLRELGDHASFEPHMHHSAADRIEELEDKLAKAVEALRFYAEGEWPKEYPGGVLFAAGDDTPEFKTHIDYGDKARTTIAKLTGGKDE